MSMPQRRPKGYQLYIESGSERDPFVFEIDRKVLKEGDPESVKVRFKARDNADTKLRNNFNEWYRIEDYYNNPCEWRDNHKIVRDIDKHRGSYPDAMEASLPLRVDRKQLFLEVLGVEDSEVIFTDLKKKLKLDTAKDANLL